MSTNLVYKTDYDSKLAFCCDIFFRNDLKNSNLFEDRVSFK